MSHLVVIRLVVQCVWSRESLLLHEISCTFPPKIGEGFGVSIFARLHDDNRMSVLRAKNRESGEGDCISPVVPILTVSPSDPLSLPLERQEIRERDLSVNCLTTTPDFRLRVSES